MNRLLFINNTNTVDAGLAAVTDPTQVPDQQVGIFDADNLAGGTLNLTGANAASRMIFVQGDDKDPFVSQVIEKSAIKRAITQAYRPEVHQVTHIGFSGSGSLGISAAEGDAFARVTRIDKGFEQFPRVTANVIVNSGDTQYDIAHKLALDFNTKEGIKSFLDADVLVNQASSQLVDTDGAPANVTLDVTNGSTIAIANVTAAADINANVGDYIRIGSAADLNDPVYKIESMQAGAAGVDALEITLDRPYAGSTATGVAAGTLDADIVAQEAGVELTAKDSEEVKNYVETSAAISFSTSLSEEFAGTTVAIGTTPQTGSGRFEQVRKLERKFAGIMHSFLNRNYFPQTPEYYAQEGTNYDICTVLVDIDNDRNVVKSNNQLAITFAYDTGAALGTQLETFFGVD